MATVTFAYDHSRDPMNPNHLARLIATSLSLAAPPNVDIDPTQIVVSGSGVAEANRAAIQSIITAYVYDADQAKLPPGNEGVFRGKIASALTANSTFLATASPTSAQNAAQIKALTRQMNALIRLAVGQLDDASGT